VTADQREEGTEGDRRQGGMAKEMKRRSRNMEDRIVQEMLREDFWCLSSVMQMSAKPRIDKNRSNWEK
jgi:hypothetical protein